MPAKNTKKLRDAQQRRIVKQRLSGATLQEVADTEGVSAFAVASAIKRNAALVARLTEEHTGALSAAYALAVQGLYADLTHESPSVRHDARQVLLKYICAADRLGQQAQQQQQQDATQSNLCEVLAVYARMVRS